MVNLKPPEAPEMQVVDGYKVRPEDVKRVKERQEARAHYRELIGVQRDVPIVGVGTENRRKTDSELYEGEPFDPAESVLSRESAESKPAGKRAASKSDSGSS